MKTEGDNAGLADVMAALIKADEEADGALQFCKLSIMPRRLSLNGADSRETLERMGFVVTGEYDDLFYDVTFPEGWTRFSNETLWTRILDSKGRERGAVFYKASLHDRKASMSATNRYSARSIAAPVGKFKHEMWVFDCATPIKRICQFMSWTWIVGFASWRDGGYPAFDAAYAWLDENFPDWRDPFAYWD